ncbi:sulfite exporter TauE/SafE family protein [Bosea sp. BK604]|uniref:sulfite exporter TauE/SafE family protein n=1 Tax=Bosea sp. BK604 TaxID=2512180 RepID=UPI001047DA2F|nr:sulfite exporter TauE/SafE family protein [Bosea sp. BK604]TCR67028.1 sulfite exporter TauE/SafE [Bosea sp. BK604]
MTLLADPALLGSAAHVATALAVGAAALIGSLLSALTGSGGAIVLSLVLAPIIGVAAVVQTLSVAMLLSHVARVGAFWRLIDWPVTGRILLAAIPSCFAGALLYTKPDEAAGLVLGLFLIAVVVLKRVFAGRSFRVGPAGLLAASAVFGLLSGTTIGGGLLVIPILLGAGLAGAALVATDAIVGLTMHLIKTLVFGQAAVLTGAQAWLGAVIGICMFPGAWLARALLARIPLKVHALLLDIVVALGGASFVIQALRRWD